MEIAYLTLCKKQIQELFNLDSEKLSQRDFEYLHKVILDKVGIDLSTATLRRIWSRNYQGIPQVNTLNALAKVLGYEDWFEFKLANEISTQSQTQPTTKRRIIILIGIMLVALVGWKVFDSMQNRLYEAYLMPEIHYKEGVPATIGFHYDIHNFSNEVKIQLSWNPNEQTILDPQNNFYTGTYYYPDFHYAKLISNNSILTQQTVHITTPNWHGLLMQSALDPNPIYLRNTDFLGQDDLNINPKVDSIYQLQTMDFYSVLTLSNRSLERISGDNFVLLTTFKSFDKSSQRPCKQTDILLKGETGNIRIPISNPGCYGVTDLHCSDQILSGKNRDLSNLSADLAEEQTIRIESNGKTLLIQVADNPKFEVNYGEPICHLKVIKFIFMGSGTVSQFDLFDLNNNELQDESLKPF